MKTKISILLLLVSSFIFSQGVVTPLDQLKLKYPVNGTSHDQVVTRESVKGLTGVIPKTDLLDVLEYANYASFPATGAIAKIYVDKAANILYRWSGSAYVVVSPSSGVQSVTGDNVDNTDPLNPVVNLQDIQSVLSQTNKVYTETIGDYTYELSAFVDEGGKKLFRIGITNNETFVQSYIEIIEDKLRQYLQDGSELTIEELSTLTVGKEIMVGSGAGTNIFKIPFKTVEGSSIVSQRSDLPTGNYDLAVDTKVISSDYTAVNGENLTVVANAVITDPSPVNGKGYIVHVTFLGVTATVGGVAYPTGSLIYRFFYSGTWVSKNYDASTVLTSSITNGDTTHAPNGDAVFDALALKSNLASPTFTGTPNAPTQSANDNTTKIATTAYADAKVQNSLSASTTVAPSATAVNTALGSYLTTATASSTYAPIASPTFTGTVTTPALNVSGATASTTAEFDGSKNLISATKGTAYNKSFGTGTTNIPEIGATLVASRGLMTDASGKLISNATSAVQRWRSGADGTSVSSTTTPTITYSQLIPAGTFVTGDVPELYGRATSSAAKTATTDFTIYVNTSNSLSGATQVGRIATYTPSRTITINRFLAIKGATTKVVTATSSADVEGIPSGAESTFTIDWTVDQYIIFGITHSTSADEMHGDLYKITN